MRILVICIFSILLCGCGKADQVSKYKVNPNLKPLHPEQHFKWISVQGGQISVDKYDLINEFVTINGKRYSYKKVLK